MTGLAAFNEWPELRFADTHIDRIVSGKKTATFRIDLDAAFEEGEPFWVCDSDGERVVAKRVGERLDVPLETAAGMDVPGHRTYESPQRLIRRMEAYYPDHEITTETTIDVLRWDV